LEHNNLSKFTVTPSKGSVPASTMFPHPLLRWFVRVVES